MDSAIQRFNNRALDPGGNQLICFPEAYAQSYFFNPDSCHGILNHSAVPVSVKRKIDSCEKNKNIWITVDWALIESFRFWDENHYEIFSIPSSAHA